LRKWVPLGEPDLQKAFLDDYLTAVEWMRRNGVNVAPKVISAYILRAQPVAYKHEPQFEGIMTIGIGYPIRIDQYLALARRRLGGAHLLVNSRVVQLLRDDRKTSGITGAIVEQLDTSKHRVVRARRTILASGGFQGSHALVSRHVGPDADNVFVRSNPGNVGDGLELALAAGAATSKGLSTFYVCPVTPPRLES
jgi:succinate dehydrogenase/fumarate reductase flavoprotein subunit